MASTYLTRTNGTSTNVYKGTVSHWVKRSGLGAMGTFAAWNNGVSDTNRGYLNFNNDDIYFYDQANSMILETNRKFRDTSAWYHIVLAWDTSQSTASDRVKIYVNGVQETSFSTENYPSQNSTLVFNTSGRTFGLGSYANSGSAAGFFDGSMSHFHFTDGYTYAASAFGSTDATTGEWQINTSPSVTYGNNGFFILKDTNSGTDQSPNSNNLTVGGGTLTKTEDNPSNVFATANPNDVMKGSAGILKPTFSNGNLTLSSSAGNNYQTFGTIAVDTGKYYWETKATDCDGHRVGVFFGDNKVHGGSYYFGANAFYIHQNGQIYYNGANTVYMSSLSDGDIVGVALDRTNGHIYLHKNGQYADGNGNNDQTFANAVSISTKLGVTMPSDITYPFFDVYGTAIMDINFGNGYFGSTQISSAGTNASGIGIFEYDVPTGYTALSTKGLNL